jgi:uncharacterized SAM-binding protein YcdF (DUF218 family)
MLQELDFLKPVFTALAMPPTIGLLIALLGWLLIVRSQYLRTMGTSLVFTGLATLWLLSCNGFAIVLDRNFLPQTIALSARTPAQDLRDRQVQAIVVLGGGVEAVSREYGAPQASNHTSARLHYGVVLAKASGLPLGFSGGVGWAAVPNADTEAAAAQRWLAQLGLPPLRWAEGKSRDTRENAQAMAAVLKKDGITRIALVTHAWHMPRAQLAFENTGLTVMPAPMSYIEAAYAPLLEWLPSAQGLQSSRHVLRELLARAML